MLVGYQVLVEIEVSVGNQVSVGHQVLAGFLRRTLGSRCRGADAGEENFEKVSFHVRSLFFNFLLQY